MQGFERTNAQRMAALGRANTIRFRRAELKDELRVTGAAHAAELVADPPDWLGSMPVYDLLRALPGVGPTKSAKATRVVGITPSKTLAALTARQRAVLVTLLLDRPRRERTAA